MASAMFNKVAIGAGITIFLALTVSEMASRTVPDAVPVDQSTNAVATPVAAAPAPTPMVLTPPPTSVVAGPVDPVPTLDPTAPANLNATVPAQAPPPAFNQPMPAGSMASMMGTPQQSVPEAAPAQASPIPPQDGTAAPRL